MENTDLITVDQLPIISEHLQTVKGQIERLTAEAMSLVCTVDTLTTVKKTRAELTRQFTELENSRKAVKKAVMEPYEAFERVYKECVTAPFSRADNDLRQKITDTEDVVKAEAEAEIREYFSELATDKGIGWLEFESMNLKIGMTEAQQKTLKKLKDQVREYVSRVSRDWQTISGMENAVELMVEFRKCLNMAEAIQTVTARHKALEAEKEAAAQYQERQTAIQQAVNKVEAVLPPQAVEPPTTKEKVYTCTFTVKATKSQLKALKSFLQANEIEFK